jgi:hypothetical protein
LGNTVLDDFSQIIGRKKTSNEKTCKNLKKKILSSQYNIMNRTLHGYIHGYPKTSMDISDKLD